MDNKLDYCNRIIVSHYDNLPSELLSKIPMNILKINDNDGLYKLDKSMIVNMNELTTC